MTEDIRDNLHQDIAAALRLQFPLDDVDGGLTFVQHGRGYIALDLDAVAQHLLDKGWRA